MKRIDKGPITLNKAIILFVIGIILGTVFTFGMSFWNEKVVREDCTEVRTQLVSYEIIEELMRPGRNRGIDLYCANGETYYIDSSSVNKELKESIKAIQKNDPIELLIHPNSNTVVEFFAPNGYLLEFDDTMSMLTYEKNGFFFLGIFAYLLAVTGLYYIIVFKTKKHRRKK